MMSFDVEVDHLGEGDTDLFQAFVSGEELDSVFVGEVQKRRAVTIEFGFFGVDEDLGLGLGFEELPGPFTVLKPQINEPLGLPVPYQLSQFHVLAVPSSAVERRNSTVLDSLGGLFLRAAKCSQNHANH